jgi:lipid II:glycine glycyltransferase (peptidoglycan interpeptide bridge formation enzyme)
MNHRIVTFSKETDRDNWNNFVSTSPWGHLMQGWEWGAFKQITGWQVERLGLEQDGQLVAGAQVLIRSLPLLPMAIAYIPKGPIVDLDDEKTATTLFSAIHQAARRQRAIFLKIEPNALDQEATHSRLCRYGFQSSTQTNQPRSTIIIDLSPGEAALQAAMRRKTRQLIRRAARDGVEIVEGDSADLDAFYTVLADTGEIKEIPVHEKEFYKQAWQTFHRVEAVKLILAKYQGEVVAGKMIFVFKDRSMHFWGGTSSKGRDINASYLIQWESIRWAMSQGYHYCDLWGIPDEIAGILRRDEEVPQDQQKGLWGVYTFKRGFGGEIESYVGAYDYPYSPLLYQTGMKILSGQRTVDLASHWLESLQRR